MYISLFMPVAKEDQRGIKSGELALQVIGNVCRYWELSPGLLQEQYVHIISPGPYLVNVEFSHVAATESGYRIGQFFHKSLVYYFFTLLLCNLLPPLPSSSGNH